MYCDDNVESCYVNSHGRSTNNMTIWCNDISDSDTQCYFGCYSNYGCQNSSIYCIESNANCYSIGQFNRNIMIINTSHRTLPPTLTPTSLPTLLPTSLPTLSSNIYLPTTSPSKGTPLITSTAGSSNIPTISLSNIVLNISEMTSSNSPTKLSSVTPTLSSHELKSLVGKPATSYWVFIIIVLIPFIVVLLIGVFICILCRKKRQHRNKLKIAVTQGLSPTFSVVHSKSNGNISIMEDSKDISPTVPITSYDKTALQQNNNIEGCPEIETPKPSLNNGIHFDNEYSNDIQMTLNQKDSVWTRQSNINIDFEYENDNE